MARLRVRVIPPMPGFYGNIYWPSIQPCPMRAGKFPPLHPVNLAPPGAMDAFRARGYWASCFPEGDGITFQVEAGQDAATMERDVAECFGWEVLK